LSGIYVPKRHDDDVGTRAGSFACYRLADTFFDAAGSAARYLASARAEEFAAALPAFVKQWRGPRGGVPEVT
jgi:hypothetical protein